MPAEVLDAATFGNQATITWSKHPQPGSDIVCYFNHYTYKKSVHNRLVPDASKILYMYEPVSVDPMQYTSRVWDKFDHVLTWHRTLAALGGRMRFCPMVFYDLPYTDDYGLTVFHDENSITDRKKAICQIVGDKYSLAPEELYSNRRKIARWFSRDARIKMDVYGKPSSPLPNYCGISADKRATLARYRYCLCFENTYDSLWSRDYITEKLFDCMYAGTIPVYYGASNIESLIPSECYIDFRQFKSLRELDEYLYGMSESRYLEFVEAMHRFIARYNAPKKHAVAKLYEAILATHTIKDAYIRAPESQLDYLSGKRFSQRLRVKIMDALLRYPQIIHPLFNLIRRLRS